VQAARNIAIIALLALVVAAVPGGGNLANGILAVISIGFLVAIGATGYFLYRDNRLGYMALPEQSRWLLVGGLGAIVLMIAGADELLDSAAGFLVWIGVLGLSGFAVFRVVTEARKL